MSVVGMILRLAISKDVVPGGVSWIDVSSIISGVLEALPIEAERLYVNLFYPKIKA